MVKMGRKTFENGLKTGKSRGETTKIAKIAKKGGASVFIGVHPWLCFVPAGGRDWVERLGVEEF